MKALVLAAGLGTRLRPYTLQRPKPLFTLGGRPLLELILRRLEASGCTAAMINTHHLPGMIEAFLTRQRYAMSVNTRHEPVILDTAGAVRNVADFWRGEPLLLVNGDVLCNADLTTLWEAHRRSGAAATLLLHHHPDFAHVSVDDDGGILGFHLPLAADGHRRRLAFTGIQVLAPRVLDLIPESGPASLIDLYRRLIRAGDAPRALEVSGHVWEDIGTPERYRRLAASCLAAAAFGLPWPDARQSNSVAAVRLRGDGSERLWYRLTHGQRSAILVDHGIHGSETVAEVDAFIAIGRHLARCGIPVPQILKTDAFAGMAIVEDLGDLHLERAVQDATSQDAVCGLYRRVIDQVVRMNRIGAQGFDPAWAYQGSSYSREMILTRECGYFLEQFVTATCRQGVAPQDFAPEFERLAERIATLTASDWGFMHRDCQSRNIMLRGSEPFFIDFQGGRLGPVQYDLAALLADPYVDLPHRLQEELIAWAAHRVGQPAAVLRQTMGWCGVSRGLQALGAYGRLSRLPGRSRFRDHIPAGLRQLQRNLNRLEPHELPRLRALVQSLGPDWQPPC
jgi:aminoglycoside/choline kinase family phosphotransferase/GTP:adenosylcobinamide-phosphate guanylyltransferase